MRAVTFVLGTLITLSACSSSQEATGSCTEANWRTCETPPSLESRSKPWPEQRAALGRLAEATEWAVQHPTAWDAAFHRFDVSEPVSALDVYSKTSEWGQTLDLVRRHYPIRDARIKLDSAVGTYVTLVAQRAGRDASGTSLTELQQAHDAMRAAHALSEAEDAWQHIHALDLFRDSFGQPEPRKALLAYAVTATKTQFLLRDPAARRARAAAAQAFLEERIREWEQMQRDRLVGRPENELQGALDALGTPELRRTMAAWTAIASLNVPSAT